MARLEYILSGNNKSLSATLKESTSGVKALGGEVDKVNVKVKKELPASIGELKRAIVQLNKEKVEILDESKLKRQQKLIQELEADLKRTQNLGKVGFNDAGIAIEKSSSGLKSFGSGLSNVISPLRTLAYIVPGIGLAGIFNLAFEGIAAAASQLDIFNTKLTTTQSNLANLNEVNKNAAKQYGEESTNLRILYNAATDVNNATNNRLLAAKELQKEFPSLFGNLKTEAILNGDAAGAYDVATKAILDNAKAKAAAGKISELAGRQLESDFKIEKINIANQNEKIIAERNSFKNTKAAFEFQQKQRTGSAQLTAEQLSNIKKVSQASISAGNIESDNRAKQAKQAEKENKKSLQTQIEFLTAFAGGNNKIAQALSDGQNTKTGSSGEGSPFATLNNQLDDILRKTQALSGQAGLTGYALDVQKVKDKYVELNATLDENIKKTNESKKLSTGERSVLEGKQSADRIALAKSEAAELQGEFNKSVLKAFEATDKIIEKRKEAAEKALKLEQELQAKITEINNQAIANIGGKLETETDKIRLEWDKRLKAANEYYDGLIKLNNANTQNDPLGFKNAIKSLQIQGNKAATGGVVQNASDSEVTRKLIEPFSRGIDLGMRKFATDFYNTLTDVETFTKGSFTSIFADLTSKLTTSLNQVFLNVVVQGLSNALQKAISSPGNGLVNATGGLTGLGKVAAGAAIGGAVISAATPKTSTIGQGLGGALSGAGTGAAIGSIVPVIGTVAGAVIGGTIGLLSGIFGSASARKKEEEQRQAQLEEAKKQTAIQKAQLDAYTSQIVGRVTAAGVISSVSVGAQGQLVANVSGKDLQFVLDRTKKSR